LKKKYAKISSLIKKKHLKKWLTKFKKIFLKKIKPKKNSQLFFLFRLLKNMLPFLAVFGILLLAEASYFFVRNQLANRLPFGIQIAQIDFSFTETKIAEKKLAKHIQKFLEQPLEFKINDEIFFISAERINLKIFPQHVIEANRYNLIDFRNLALPVTLDAAELREALLEQAPQLETNFVSAQVFFNDSNELEIIPEKIGRMTDFSGLVPKIQKTAGILNHQPITVFFTDVMPPYTVSQIKPLQDELAILLRGPLIFKKTEFEIFEIPLTKRLYWFDLKEKPVLRTSELEKFIQHELAPLVTQLPQGVKIFTNTEGKIEFEGLAYDGQEINREELFVQVNEILNTDEREVWIPFKKLSAPVSVPEILEEQGIKELIGSAETDYTGSSSNRSYNIQVAAKKLNGQIIEPEENFSFVNNLGPINYSAGYRSGWVIKKGEVVLEVGGGVCQVSTTFFRVALDTGLPITEQKAHSLKVAYYSPPGLDATIYPGQVDLKFKNDTGYPILIQAAVLDDIRLRVNFFGMSDGRQIKIEGPFYPNGDPIQNLAKAGLRMFWTREIIYSDDRDMVEEKYSTVYRSLIQ
jgi:vancomycin resistance protein YoaR